MADAGDILFAAEPMIDRARTETHLFSEDGRIAFSQKPQDDLRGVRSHQVDFLSRNCEWLFQPRLTDDRNNVELVRELAAQPSNAPVANNANLP
jgi:hypothetical protein